MLWKLKKKRKSTVIRFIMDNLPIDSTASQIKSFFQKKHFHPIFVNIQVPPASQFIVRYEALDLCSGIATTSSQPRMRHVIVHTLSCFVELTTTKNVQKTKHRLSQLRYHKQRITIRWIENEEKQELTFHQMRPSFQWYPDLMKHILSYFHSPPIHTTQFERDNSYILLFLTSKHFTLIHLLKDSFYSILLLIALEGTLLRHVSDYWKRNKAILHAAATKQLCRW